VTDARLTLTIAPAPPIFVVDLWDDVALDFGALNAVRVEPRRWWLIGVDAPPPALTSQLSGHGSLTPNGGGLMRAVLAGMGWRTAAMVSGWFNAEDAAFTIGNAGATLIHHSPVWLHVVEADVCHAYYPASMSAPMARHWQHLEKAGS